MQAILYSESHGVDVPRPSWLAYYRSSQLVITHSCHAMMQEEKLLVLRLVQLLATLL